MSMTRRDVLQTLPAVSASLLTAFGALAIAADASAQTALPTLPSEAWTFEELKVDKSPDGAEFRAVLKGKLATGEILEVHETMLPPGGMPHPPHHHVHSEMWLVREGTVEFNVMGKKKNIGPGGVALVASNQEHGITNVGKTQAKYFVVAVGPDAGQ
ncbi:MAG TPA: cupin domain-containing protein [Candidatus Sulfotelmatobacter sp.]|nr:cupin domain-containing protein [Candidatus Sulfotelmatobacter sp.]